MISERAIQLQRIAYLCFIDCTKAFKTLNEQDDLDISGKVIRIIQNQNC